MTEQSRATIERNYRLGVVNGLLFTLGDTLSSAGLVLALLVRQLGGSLTLVGLLPALQSGGYLLAHMLVGGRLQAMPQNMPIYRRAAVARVLAFSLLIAATFAAGWFSPAVALWLIVLCYTIFNVGGGTSTLAFQNIVAKTIPPRRRGSFFGARQLFGGLLGFAVAGPLVRWLLGVDGPLGFPANYGTLLVLAVTCYAVALYAFSVVDEPAQAVPGEPLPVAEVFARAPGLLRENHNYRWFIISRVIGRFGMIAEPFYIIYATESLGLPSGVAGIYLAVRAITGALSNLLWSRVADRRGTRRLILLTVGLSAVTPLLALAAPAVASAAGAGAGGLMAAMGLVFLASGVVNDGNNMAGMTYLLDVAPEDERPIYIGLANTVLGIATLVPVIGGWLVTTVGYQWTFVVGLVCCLLSLACARLLREREPLPAPLEQAA